MTCPQCGGGNVTTTLMAYHYIGQPGKDHNRSRCLECHWQGEAWEAGAPLVPPLKGTEGWTEEQVAEFKAQFGAGHLDVVEAQGIAIVNTRALQRLSITRE